MKKYSKNFKNYLRDLGAKRPSPGGGSACVLSLCLGISLIEKAINYSLDKNASLKNQAQHLSLLKNKLKPYIDLDAELFKKYMKTKGPARFIFLKKGNKICIDTIKAAHEVILLTKRVEFSIKKSIISDFYIGLELVKIALKGCRVNLELNREVLAKAKKS